MTRPPSRPPVESIELRLDPVADAAVRELWLAADAAGAASLARSGYNAPHLTLAAVAHTGGTIAALRGAAGDAVAPLVGTMLRLTGVATFPHARTVLYAAVVPTSELLAAHARVHAVLAGAGVAPYDTSLPGAWTPHCTIAKRVRGEHLGDAVAALAARAWPIEATVAQVVHWDGDERVVTTIAGRST